MKLTKNKKGRTNALTIIIIIILLVLVLIWLNQRGII